jgi:hypothetical protein
LKPKRSRNHVDYNESKNLSNLQNNDGDDEDDDEDNIIRTDSKKRRKVSEDSADEQLLFGE